MFGTRYRERFAAERAHGKANGTTGKCAGGLSGLGALQCAAVARNRKISGSETGK